jgi:hypothetical protein
VRKQERVKQHQNSPNVKEIARERTRLDVGEELAPPGSEVGGLLLVPPCRVVTMAIDCTAASANRQGGELGSSKLLPYVHHERGRTRGRR